MNIVIFGASLLFGFVLLIKGSEFFVDGAAGIAARFGIPQLVIGLTIVAMGTSAPEAAVSITAAIGGNADITVGNIVGSNILNVLLILGIASVIVSIAVEKASIRYDIPYMIFCSVLLLFQGYDGKIGIVDGVVLWIVFLGYLFYLFMQARKRRDAEETIPCESIWKLILFCVGGIVAILLGSRLAVYGATEMARLYGISERVIGLTIVALGTSLPELFTSVTAARKGNAEIAIGNIVGSNIFNILFIIGTTALIRVVPYERRFLFDTIVMIATGIILLLCVLKKHKLTRAGGMLMLFCYSLYLGYLFME